MRKLMVLATLVVSLLLSACCFGGGYLRCENPCYGRSFCRAGRVRSFKDAFAFSGGNEHDVADEEEGDKNGERDRSSGSWWLVSAA